MKNKSFAVIVAVFVVIMVAAGVLYNKIAPHLQPDNLMIETDSQAEIEQGTEDKHTQKNEATTSESEENTENSSDKVWDFTVTDEFGNEVKLSDFQGKPTIVNMWASWCGPCKSEMPDFEAKYKEYGEHINFVMVNVTDGQRETVRSAKNFITDSGYTFPVYYDTMLDASQTFGVYSLPTTLFFDSEGHGIAQGTGALSADLLQQGIDMIYPEE